MSTTTEKTPREYLLEQTLAKAREQAETLRQSANSYLGRIPDGAYLNIVDRIDRLTKLLRETATL